MVPPSVRPRSRFWARLGVHRWSSPLASLTCSKSCAALALVAVAAAAAAAGAPRGVIGGFGFNWSKPSQAACREVTTKMAQDFVGCEFSPSGAFGLPLASFACRVKGKGEIMVFSKKAECQKALETMLANGP